MPPNNKQHNWKYRESSEHDGEVLDDKGVGQHGGNFVHLVADADEDKGGDHSVQEGRLGD